ncbi:MAG TPA: hypothetical protein VN673_15375, partial [Clostridia bacterium]|nr:hypothetical protein [Clostridia bacterium]
MLDPRTTAESILGPVTWDTPTTGFCHCPGETNHTSRSGKKDCRITLDGVPTVYCFHDHCQPQVESANRALRQAMTREAWTLVMPGGTNIRAGPRFTSPPKPAVRLDEVGERIAREIAHRYSSIMAEFRWPLDAMRAQSPIDLHGYSPDDHFRRWLLLWPPDAILWIGQVTDSGRPEAAAHFRPVADWYDIGPIMGNYTCAARFHPATYSRSDQAILQREFLVVESDDLSHDEIGAVFNWLQRWCKLPLHC